MSNKETCTSVWDALTNTPEEAGNLHVQAELMRRVAGLVKERDWTLVEAANCCSVTLPHMEELLLDRLSRFSLNALVNMATAAGYRAKFDLL